MLLIVIMIEMLFLANSAFLVRENYRVMCKFFRLSLLDTMFLFWLNLGFFNNCYQSRNFGMNCTVVQCCQASQDNFKLFLKVYVMVWR